MKYQVELEEFVTLTKTQQKTVDFVIDFHLKNNRSPTKKEFSEAMKIKSNAGVNYRLDSLLNKVKNIHYRTSKPFYVFIGLP